MTAYVNVPRPRLFPVWVIVAAIAAVAFMLLAVGLGVGSIIYRKYANQPTIYTETAAERQREMLAAYGPAGSGPADPLKPTVEKFAAAYMAAITAHDESRILSLMDGPRFVAEIRGLGGLADATPAQQTTAAAAFAAGMAARFASESPAPGWRIEVGRIRRLSGTEIMVYLWHMQAGHLPGRQRWFLRLDRGAWRLYDYEDFSIGAVRHAAFYAYWHPATQLTAAPWTTDYDHVRLANLAATAGKHAEADAQYRRATVSLYPPELQASTRVLWADTLLSLGRYAEAADQARQAADGTRADANYVLAKTYNALRQYEDARTSALRYMEMDGEDAAGAYQLAVACVNLKRPAEAADACRRGLDALADFPALLGMLADALPAGKRGEVAERFGRIALPADEALEEAAPILCYTRERAEALEAILARYAKGKPDALRLGYYTARVQQTRGEYTQAAATLEPLLAQATGKDNQRLHTTYLMAMCAQHKELDAYEGDPDKLVAFRFVAPRLSAPKYADMLRQLIDRHAAAFPRDPWPHYYRGQQLAQAKKYAEAETEYAAADGLASDPDDLRQIRYARVTALHAAGKGLAAYARLADKQAVFDQLAWLFFQNKQPDDLAALVEAHRANAPDSVELLRWWIDADWLRGNYADVLEMLTANRATLSGDKRTTWWFHDRLIRTLVLLRKYDQAMAEVASRHKEGDTPEYYHLLLIHANAGDATATIGDAESLLKDDEDYSLEDLYADPALGPALQSPALAAFRAKHPKPLPPTTTPTTQSDDE